MRRNLLATDAPPADSSRAFFARIAAEAAPSTLSYAEEFFWWASRLAGDATYNTRFGFRLAGPLRTDLLTRAIGEIVRRHEPLRTVYPFEDGVIRRAILPPESVRVTVDDLSGVAADAREAEAMRRARVEADVRFHLGRGPLFRVNVIRLAPDDHLLQFTVHHLVIDGQSVPVLLQELSALYRAECRGEPSPLPPLPARYADYAAERRLAHDRAMPELIDHWTARLAGVPSLLGLPADRPRRAARRYEGRTVRVGVPASLTAAVVRFARDRGTTVFAVLLATLQTLLHRLSGDESVVVGAPFGQRWSPELRRLIGLFVELAPLRADFGGNPRMSDVLAAVRRTTFEAFDRAGIPIHVLLSSLAIPVDPSHSALFQVLFKLDRVQEHGLTLDGLRAVPVRLDEDVPPKFDMMVSAILDETLRFEILYRRDLFTEPRMQALADQLVHLLDQVVAAPDARVSEYSLPTANAVTAVADATRPDADLLARLREHADTAPDRTAVVDGQERLTYRQLQARSDAQAWDLSARGVEPGHEVALAADAPSCTLACAIVGALKAGARYLLVSPDAPGDDDDRSRGARAGDHARLSACGRWTTEAFALPADLGVGVVRGTDVASLPLALATALWSGGTLVAAPCSAPGDDPLGWFPRAVHVAYGDAAAWRRLAGAAGALPELRCAFITGDTCLRADIGRVRALTPHAVIARLFAARSAPLAPCCHRIADAEADGPPVVPIGAPVAGARLHVRSRGGPAAGIGEIGQLWVERDDEGGAAVATGLAARYLPDGAIDLLGDAARSAIVDGYRVRLDEIADALLADPAAVDVEVRVERQADRTELCACVTTDDARATAEQFAAGAAGRLPAFMVPRHVTIRSRRAASGQ